jgi:hypothetical protein
MKFCLRASVVLAFAAIVLGVARGQEASFPFVIPGDDASPSPTDLSGLSPRPAGADGFVRVRNGHFSTEAGRIRFWGVNLSLGANFPAHVDAEKVAAHLAKLGVNAVRLHHHDTADAPQGIWGPVVNGHRTLSAESLDRQDYFLDQLARQGIYANLNLHVGRELTSAEGISRTGLPYAARYDKYLLYFMPQMRERLKEFSRAYLLHENPYRKLRRVDDPAIAMIEITNENAFSSAGPAIATKLPEPFHGEFKQQWNDWLARRYRTTAAMLAAWGSAEPNAISRGGSIAAPPGGPLTCPENQNVESHSVDIPGVGWPPAAMRDVHQFMVETERAFFADLVDFLRHDLGVRVPITGTQLTYGDTDVIAATSDYADVHAYWDHPRFGHKPWDPVDWTIKNTPLEATPGSCVLLEQATRRLLDRPFTLSEWNIPEPNDYAAGTAPFAALVGSLQDWDGVFFFGYSSSGENLYPDAIERYFSFNGQPAKLALLAVGAKLFRSGDISPLTRVLAGTPQQRVPPAAAFSYRVGVDAQAVAAPAEPAIDVERLATPADEAIWDASDRSRAHIAVETPTTRAVWGLIAGQRFTFGDIEFAVGATVHDYGVIVFTTLDGLPVARTRHALLVAVDSAENAGVVWNAARTSIADHWGKGPTRVNGVPVEFTTSGSGFHVYALDGRGHRTHEVPPRRSGQSSTFHLGTENRTLWYEVVAAQTP